MPQVVDWEECEPLDQEEERITQMLGAPWQNAKLHRGGSIPAMPGLRITDAPGLQWV